MIPITTRQFIYEIGQLRLRGDVIIRCYQITTNERTLNLHSAKMLNRELIFSTQFHTCAITERDVTFYRSDLDYACDGKLPFYFSLSAKKKINQKTFSISKGKKRKFNLKLKIVAFVVYFLSSSQIREFRSITKSLCILVIIIN